MSDLILTGTGALREIIRLGERTLNVQEAARESALRRAGELLRLTIADIAGVIVIGGILATVRIPVEPGPTVFAVLGIVLMILSASILSIVLSGTRYSGVLVAGPDFQRLADHVSKEKMTQRMLHGSIVLSLPDWIMQNERRIARVQRMSGYAIIALSVGTGLFFGALLYIGGGVLYG